MKKYILLFVLLTYRALYAIILLFPLLTKKKFINSYHCHQPLLQLSMNNSFISVSNAHAFVCNTAYVCL